MNRRPATRSSLEQLIKHHAERRAARRVSQDHSLRLLMFAIKSRRL